MLSATCAKLVVQSTSVGVSVEFCTCDCDGVKGSDQPALRRAGDEVSSTTTTDGTVDRGPSERGAAPTDIEVARLTTLWGGVSLPSRDRKERSPLEPEVPLVPRLVPEDALLSPSESDVTLLAFCGASMRTQSDSGGLPGATVAGCMDGQRLFT